MFQFSPDELELILCGEQSLQWTRDNVITYTEPKLGYTRESSAFQHFVSMMVEMTADERKRFLQFATGCSSLPPGGLANLQPRLTIVHKMGASEEGATIRSVDASYPSSEHLRTLSETPR